MKKCMIFAILVACFSYNVSYASDVQVAGANEPSAVIYTLKKMWHQATKKAQQAGVYVNEQTKPATSWIAANPWKFGAAACVTLALIAYNSKTVRSILGVESQEDDECYYEEEEEEFRSCHCA